MNERFWHEIEGRPWAEVQAIQEAALRRQLAYLEAASAFYRDKLRAAGVRFDAVKTAADLARVPLTLKTELRESLAAQPPLGRHLVSAMPGKRPQLLELHGLHVTVGKHHINRSG